MNSSMVDVRERVATDLLLDSTSVVKSLAVLLPGAVSAGGDGAALVVPSYAVRQDENGWKSLVTDPGEESKRRGLLAHLVALRNLNTYAESRGLSLVDAARERGVVLRRTLEMAWISLLEQNRKKEEAIRWAALFFSNLQSSQRQLRGKIFAIDARADEIASDAGRQMLGKELSRYYSRPDPTQSRGYVVVQGWVGNRTALERLARVVQEHRAMLFTDAPAYPNEEQLREAASEGALLESLAGDDIPHRYTVLFGNRGRARHRFQGQFGSESSDVYLPLSGPWVGMHLDNVVRGFPWKPAVGYQNAIAGIDGVEIDLLLHKTEGYAYFANHRVNPAILLCDNSQQVVIWGPDTLCRIDGGIQIGMADTEMQVIRYTEWIVNKYGLLHDLDQAEDIVKSKLTRFVTQNSGANRMFRAGSRVLVNANHKERCLTIDYQLLFREVAERALIHMMKPVEKTKNSNFEVTK